MASVKQGMHISIDLTAALAYWLDDSSAEGAVIGRVDFFYTRDGQRGHAKEGQKAHLNPTPPIEFVVCASILSLEDLVEHGDCPGQCEVGDVDLLRGLRPEAHYI